MRVTIALAASLLACAGSARADDPGTERLLALCKMPDKSPEGSFCAGFVGAIGDMMVINGMALKTNPKDPNPWYLVSSMCPDPKVTMPSTAAFTQSFVNWATAHPERWNDEALPSVMTALKTTWSCM